MKQVCCVSCEADLKLKHERGGKIWRTVNERHEHLTAELYYLICEHHVGKGVRANVEYHEHYMHAPAQPKASLVFARAKVRCIDTRIVTNTALLQFTDLQQVLIERLSESGRYLVYDRHWLSSIHRHSPRPIHHVCRLVNTMTM